MTNQRGNFLDKSILPQNSDWWKLIRDVGESWLPDKGPHCKAEEERHGLAQGWLEEYSLWAASAKLHGHGLDTLRAEYVHCYNKLLDHEKQPHCDFFLNLSPEAEEELDFEEE